MTLVIRDVREHELDSVLALNNAVGPRILPLDSAGVRWFFTHAEYFRIAEIDGVIAGFLIALRETSSYSSPNFLWFRARYPKFLYIDRIVIAESYRRHGLGRIFYCDVTSYAELRVPLLTCEVFLEPRDDATVLFHGTYGVQEVGQQLMSGVGRPVSLLAKTLCSHEFVLDTYLLESGGQLPDLAWTAERIRRNPDAREARASAG